MSGWQERPLGEVCEIYQPESLSKKDLPPSAPYPVYGANGQIGWYDRFNHDQSQVVLGCRGSCGAINVTPPCSWITSNAMVIAPRNETLSKPLLRYLLEALDLSEVISGVAQPQITRASLAPVIIRFPSSASEQQRIVAILDEAFQRIFEAETATRRAIANLEELIVSFRQASVMIPAPNWIQLPLTEVCVVDWGNTNLTKSSYVADGDFLAVSAAGCDGRIGHFEHEAFVPVLSAIGARCGRMFLPTEPFTAIKNTITLTPRTHSVSGQYLFHLLRSIELPQRGAGQPFISKGDIQQFQVTLPPLDEQPAIVNRIERSNRASEALRVGYERRLDLLSELKQSLLARAFSGELTCELRAA